MSDITAFDPTEWISSFLKRANHCHIPSISCLMYDGCVFQVEVERMRGRAQDKLMNKLAAARHKAEEKRAAAETKRNKLEVRTEQQAEYIRRTGRIPTSFSCWNWCS